MATVDLSRVRALSFDCYGTLIDWESGIVAALTPWARRRGVRADAEALLGWFARAEPEAEAAAPASPYRVVLRDVMRRIGRLAGAPVDEADERRLADSVGAWPAFGDTPAALARLKSRCALVIVSNVDRESFEGTRPRLGVAFDAVVTAEEVGAYKPDPRMFDAADAAMGRLGIAPGERVHVAQSLHHDIAPASARGWRTCWVDRRAGRPGGATPAPAGAVRADLTVPTLAALADLIESAQPDSVRTDGR
ncbi:MAG: HAD family hydrolase [Planctomycetota bacterium]|nr:MAG: HAD family hydrolase [Planctomycetota bacterium]